MFISKLGDNIIIFFVSLCGWEVLFMDDYLKMSGAIFIVSGYFPMIVTLALSLVF